MGSCPVGRWVLGAWFAVFAAGGAGCSVSTAYLFTAASGQLDFLARAEPIEDALADPTLTDAQRDKLDFVIRARDYAEDVIGLRVNDSYQAFVNLDGEPLAWNLSASRKDAFEPYLWDLPIVGPFPYLGYFDFDEAIDERDRLVDLGYDTMVYELDTYAISFLPDPITSAMLDRDYASLSDTVMHELLHNTILRLGDQTFSESLATFVGRRAGIEFIRAAFGEDTEMAAEAVRHNEDEDRFNAFVLELMEELEALYRSDLSSEEKIAARKPIFDAGRERLGAEVVPAMHEPSRYELLAEFPFNNAFILANLRYHEDLDLYGAVHEATGGVWGDTLARFSQAAASDDPQAYLREWLAGQ